MDLTSPSAWVIRSAHGLVLNAIGMILESGLDRGSAAGPIGGIGGTRVGAGAAGMSTRPAGMNLCATITGPREGFPRRGRSREQGSSPVLRVAVPAPAWLPPHRDPITGAGTRPPSRGPRPPRPRARFSAAIPGARRPAISATADTRAARPRSGATSGVRARALRLLRPEAAATGTEREPPI